MNVECFTDWEQVEPWQQAWQRLAGEHPFLSWDWQRRWWQQFGAGRELRVIRVTDADGQIVGVAPWFVESSMLQGRTLKFIGSGRVCSDYLRIMCDGTRAAEVAQTISWWLLDEATTGAPVPRWNLLELDGVVGREPTINSLAEEMHHAGVTVDEKVGVHVWRFPIREDWESYCAQTVPRKHRRKLRKLMRDWIEAGRTEYREAETVDDIDRLLARLEDLHTRRRATLGDEGCFDQPGFGEFLRLVANDFLSAGRLRLGELSVDGEPTAIAYGFQFGETHYFYQCGIDPERLDCSPGFLLNLEILRRGFARGVEAYDFLRGDERYKSEFGAQPLPCRRLRIVAPDTASQIRHSLYRTGGNLRTWAQTMKK